LLFQILLKKLWLFRGKKVISLKQLREDIEKKVIDELKNITDPIKMLEENTVFYIHK